MQMPFKTRAEVLAHIERNRLKYLSRGSQRTVYEFDRHYVLKFCTNECVNPLYIHAPCPCIVEGDKWDKANAATRLCIAPIVAYGPCWVVMERAQTVLTEWAWNGQERRAEIAYQTLVARERKCNFKCYDAGFYNVGVFKDGLVKYLDYQC